ncbi:hypothetical protein DPEC_G00201430 [Dallia pectoralis]|uniref:Uncharacterized protein n=1 Tax=Dallia pectoralis TaxID=75939 RepID=A0ACC2G8Z8_DALPE|nr:hypothetical protein DPEC_G00201430 [Dallia pectoralis]
MTITVYVKDPFGCQFDVTEHSARTVRRMLISPVMPFSILKSSIFVVLKTGPWGLLRHWGCNGQVKLGPGTHWEASDALSHPGATDKHFGVRGLKRSGSLRYWIVI